MKTLFVFFWLLCLHCHAEYRVQIECGPFTWATNGHLYYLLKESNWDDAQATAIQMGGHLVSINSKEEQEWIQNNINLGQGGLWIGLTDRNIPGVFEWTSGEPVNYMNWGDGEPNIIAGNCVYMMSKWMPMAGHWQVQHSTIESMVGGLIELDPADLERQPLVLKYGHVSRLGLHLSWPTIPGRWYSLQTHTDGYWWNFDTVMAQGLIFNYGFGISEWAYSQGYSRNRCVMFRVVAHPTGFRPY